MSPQRKPSRKRARRRITRNLEAVVTIDSLASGGDGVGRLSDGRVVFARSTAPGDRVRLTAPDGGGSFLRARSVEVLEPGPGRTTPRCPVFGSCGGCAWQHVAYPIQLEAKRRILSDAIVRIGKLRDLPPIELVPSPSEYGYRGRTRVFERAGRVGYRRYHDHAIEPIAHCPVLVPEVDEALEALSLRAGTDARSAEREWELAMDRDGSVRCVALEEAGQPVANRDRETLELDSGGECIRVSPGGFMQGNRLLHGELFERVGDALEGGGHDCLVELYSGAGFFTLGLARRFERVVAIESDERACADLSSNLAVAKLLDVDVRNARVEACLEELAGSRPDAVLLDPPRSGLARGAAAALARVEAPKIVYLSCDPATLARDLGALRDAPYRLTRLTAIDLFPQTPHVEALAVLERE